MGLSSMQTCGLTIVFCLPLLFTGTVADMLPSILWNPENPFFKYLGNSARKVMPFDKLPILCPALMQYPVKRQNVYSKDQLFENLFLVDKTGYDNCNATMGTEIFRCNNPLESLHTTMVFQPTSAIPSDPLFQQGKEYYFINTASGLEETLNNREGGCCKESSMKMRIYVCRANNDPKCPVGNKVVHGGLSDWSQCIDGLQTRQCNSPFPENGGVPCTGLYSRPCSTKVSQTPECKGLSCTTNPGEKTTVQPGIPSKDTRTGAPSSPPADFRGQNSSSTSIQLFWGDVPKVSINGILLGFHVACRRQNSSEIHFKDLGDGVKRWEFKRLEKFTNYSCRLRAYNNFGNSTWSGEVVILTDEDVPSATVEYLEAWNLSSTSLHVQWGPIAFSERHGKILGYDVEITAQHGKFGRSKPKSNYTNARSLTFSGLQKYCIYLITVCALTRRGKGPSRTLTASTDEDVPDQPPQGILVNSQGKHAVQVNWRPVRPEYTNGEVLGYKVFYSDANNTSRVNIGATETRTKIDGLRPSTNYSFQILAFTAKGDGAVSTKYFAKTQSDPAVGPGYGAPSSVTGMAIVFSGISALGAVLLVVYFIRKRRLAITNDINDLNSVAVTPYATSSIDWIERIITTNDHVYESLNDEHVAPTRRAPLYINIAPDGSLDLPQHLRNIALEFEHSYENTHYRRLNRTHFIIEKCVSADVSLNNQSAMRRRRSLGGAVDNCGRPIYDRLQRTISSTATNQSESYSPEAQSIMVATERSKEIKKHHSVDLGEIGKFMQCLEGDQCSIALTELGGMGDEKSRHRRRFSVDLGEVREFIALTEIWAFRTNESTELAYQPDVQDASQNECSC